MLKAVAPLYGTHRYVEVLRHHAQENAVVLLSRLLDGLWKHGEELQCVVIAASPVQLNFLVWHLASISSSPILECAKTSLRTQLNVQIHSLQEEMRCRLCYGLFGHWCSGQLLQHGRKSW